MLKKVTTEVTYKVPAWNYCNLMKDNKKMCRFCVPDHKGYRCALYNVPLLVDQTAYANRTRECQKASAGFASSVEDIEEAESVDVKKLMKATIAEYNKQYKSLIKQGYPAALSEKLASEYVTGGNK